MMEQYVDLPEPSEFSEGISVFDGDFEKKAYITNLSEDQLLNFKIKYSCENELFVGNKNLK